MILFTIGLIRSVICPVLAYHIGHLSSRLGLSHQSCVFKIGLLTSVMCLPDWAYHIGLLSSRLSLPHQSCVFKIGL